MGAETACPDTSKFESFILLVRLGFELELFKSPIGVSVIGSETRITRSIASKIYTKNNLYVPHLRCEIQVSTFSRFKVIAFFTSVAELVILREKNRGSSDAKRRESPNDQAIHLRKDAFAGKCIKAVFFTRT